MSKGSKLKLEFPAENQSDVGRVSETQEHPPKTQARARLTVSRMGLNVDVARKSASRYGIWPLVIKYSLPVPAAGPETPVF